MNSSLKSLHNFSTTLNCEKVNVERHQKYILNWCVKEHENTLPHSALVTLSPSHALCAKECARTGMWWEAVKAW